MKKEVLNCQKKSCCEVQTEPIGLVEKSGLCPICGEEGKLVKNITVKHMLLDELIEQVRHDDYFLCMSEECDITYYTPKLTVKFNKQQMKVPIWFKKDANPKYACYCSEVTEEQVINAVIKDGATNINDVLKITRAMSNSQCQKKNPLGKCCHQIIQASIDKGLSMK
jgi:bacterioferritin-associated ferredoxin